MKRPNLENDYSYDQFAQDWFHNVTGNNYDTDMDTYCDYIESQLEKERIEWVTKLRELVEHPSCINFRGEVRSGWSIIKDALDQLEKEKEDRNKFAEWLSAGIVSNYKSRGNWYVNGKIMTTDQLYRKFKELTKNKDELSGKEKRSN